MPQGKLKVKAKNTNVIKNRRKPGKGGKAATASKHKPIQPKKQKIQEIQKLKKIITKSVNKSAEEEIRSMSKDDVKILSAAQKAAKAHHESVGQTSSSK